jgi:DNA mismatch repair ATPase MutS
MCLRVVVVSQVGNYHMGYMEEGDNRIAFMYRLVKGSAKRSFGLNVALLAKLPKEIVDRAGDMSKRLEEQVCFATPPFLEKSCHTSGQESPGKAGL